MINAKGLAPVGVNCSATSQVVAMCADATANAAWAHATGAKD